MNQHDKERRVEWIWIDGVLDVSLIERTLKAYRDVGQREWYLEHHFPGFPVMPGVFIIEAMAHCLAVIQGMRTRSHGGTWPCYIVAQAKDIRFYHYARPGDRVVFDAEVEADVAWDADRVDGRVTARVGERKIARGSLVIHRIEPNELEASTGEAREDQFGLGPYIRHMLEPERHGALIKQLGL